MNKKEGRKNNREESLLTEYTSALTKGIEIEVESIYVEDELSEIIIDEKIADKNDIKSGNLVVLKNENFHVPAIVKVENFNENQIFSSISSLAASAIDIERNSRIELVLPETLILVLDVSGSMEGEKEEQMKKACMELLSQKKEDSVDYIGLVTFADEAKVLTRPSLDYSLIDDSIMRIKAKGSTNLGSGIYLAIEFFIHPTKLKRIILTSDGLPQASENAIKAAFSAQKNHVVIDSIGIGYDCDESLLKELSKITGGRYIHITNIEELKSRFKLLSNEKKYLPE